MALKQMCLEKVRGEDAATWGIVAAAEQATISAAEGAKQIFLETVKGVAIAVQAKQLCLRFSVSPGAGESKHLWCGGYSSRCSASSS
jgi:hypothetical protein